VSADAEVSLLLVGQRRMRTLNRNFRGIDASTDVLSFPLLTTDAPSGTPLLLGDIVICLPQAAADARRHRQTLDDTLALLLTHGALHLLGYDHDDQAGARQMAETEMGILAALGRRPEIALTGRALC